MDFLNDIDNLLEQRNIEHPNTQIYLAGDLIIGLDETTSPVTIQLNEILNKHDLQDLFRLQFPDHTTKPGHTRFPFGKNERGSETNRQHFSTSQPIGKG